ncbi:MAG TPA: YncE family protein [Candidatus Angelobacter sp.]|nr:YncE family protein [Candidatus Angelobacter sp.]
MKSRFKSLWLLLGTAIFVVVAVGCNDTLRQFIVPVPGPTGDPGTLAHAITLSTNPVVPTPTVSADGSDLHIDVSGDSNVGIVPVGINPVFLGKTSNRVFIINGGDASTPATVSSYIALLPQSATVSTVTLPSTSLKPIAGATSSSGNIYVANSGSNNVDVISGGVLAVTTTLPVGTQPVMIAGNAANNKIFVVNHGSNNVTEISTIDNTVVGSPIPVGGSPIWAVMSTDGLFVFVVNQGDGTVSVIDASLDIVIATIPVGPSPNFAFYESKLKRVYVSNTGNSTISVIKANGIDLGSTPQVLPVKLADIALSGAPTSVTALSDGTRAYAALGNCPAGVNQLNILSQIPGCTGNLVSVIDVVGLRETGTIAVGPGAISLDASGDASRVFVISANDVTTVRDDVHRPNCPATETDCLPGPPLPDRTFPTPSISIIRTTTNTVLATPVNSGIVNRPLPTFHVPQQDPKCVPAVDPNFNDEVALPCAAQQPFVVRTFP